MDRRAKFAQANKEAKATALATAATIIFWVWAGFGLADSSLTFLRTPLWVWMGCVGTWIFSILVCLVLIKFVYQDMDLEDTEEESHGI